MDYRKNPYIGTQNKNIKYENIGSTGQSINSRPSTGIPNLNPIQSNILRNQTRDSENRRRWLTSSFANQNLPSPLHRHGMPDNTPLSSIDGNGHLPDPSGSVARPEGTAGTNTFNGLAPWSAIQTPNDPYLPVRFHDPPSSLRATQPIPTPTTVNNFDRPVDYNVYPPRPYPRYEPSDGSRHHHNVPENDDCIYVYSRGLSSPTDHTATPSFGNHGPYQRSPPPYLDLTAEDLSTPYPAPNSIPSQWRRMSDVEQGPLPERNPTIQSLRRTGASWHQSSRSIAIPPHAPCPIPPSQRHHQNLDVLIFQANAAPTINSVTDTSHRRLPGAEHGPRRGNSHPHGRSHVPPPFHQRRPAYYAHPQAPPAPPTSLSACPYMRDLWNSGRELHMAPPPLPPVPPSLTTLPARPLTSAAYVLWTGAAPPYLYVDYDDAHLRSNVLHLYPSAGGGGGANAILDTTPRDGRLIPRGRPPNDSAHRGVTLDHVYGTAHAAFISRSDASEIMQSNGGTRVITSSSPSSEHTDELLLTFLHRLLDSAPQFSNPEEGATPSMISELTLEYRYAKFDRSTTKRKKRRFTEMMNESPPDPGNKGMSPAPEEIPEPESCAICLSEYRRSEKVRRLPCFHLYHSTCVDRWLKNSRRCPVCRFAIDTTTTTTASSNDGTGARDLVPLVDESGADLASLTLPTL